jgi:hypothetical protein
VLGVRQYLRTKGAPSLGLFGRRGRAFALHPPLAEAHGGIVAVLRKLSILT